MANGVHRNVVSSEEWRDYYVGANQYLPTATINSQNSGGETTGPEPPAIRLEDGKTLLKEEPLANPDSGTPGRDIRAAGRKRKANSSVKKVRKPTKKRVKTAKRKGAIGRKKRSKTFPPSADPEVYRKLVWPGKFGKQKRKERSVY
jgi:hypothetical protein